MPLKVILGEGASAPVTLDSVREHPDGFFWVYSSTDDSVGLGVEYPYGSKPNYDCSETEVLLLLNPFHVESSVMEVFAQPRAHRLGYVFSLNSAGSSDHSLSTDTFFRTACFAAIWNVLKRIVVDETDVHDLGQRSFRCSISELLNDDLAVLAIHRPNLIRAGIVTSQLSADLHRHGYVSADSPTTPPPTRLEAVHANFRAAVSAGRLSLRPLSKLIALDGLLCKFLTHPVCCPNDPVLRFFYLYQIVERILDMELCSQSQKLLSELAASNPNGLNILNVYHDLKDSLSESVRLRKLFGERTNSALASSPTNDCLIAFLKGCAVEGDENYSSNLYKVRNVVFHAWWRIPENLGFEFKQVVSGLENDIPELLLSYSPRVLGAALSPTSAQDGVYYI